MILFFDLETYSECDLPKCGQYVYAHHHSTRILLLSYAIDNEPVRVLDFTADALWGEDYARFEDAFHAADRIVAHNVPFDRTVLAASYPDLQAPLSKWWCTMAAALSAGLPASLEQLAKFLGAPETKDSEGKHLIHVFSKPFYGRKRDPWERSEDWEKFIEYARRDTEAMRECYKLTPAHNYRTDRQVWLFDQEMNDRGFRVDVDLASIAADAADIVQEGLSRRVVDLTGVDVSKVMALKKWFESEGWPLPSLSRDDVEAALAEPNLPPYIKDVLTARLEFSRSTAAKYRSVLAGTDPKDGRFRGGFAYSGAERTMRWAGRRFQPQNLFLPVVDSEAAALSLLSSAGDPAVLDGWFPGVPPMDVIASAVRGVVVPAEGHVLIVADQSQIEARGLAWKAGQRDVVEQFRAHDAGETDLDVYQYTAKGVGSDDRQLGKVLTLACGYGMGPAVFQMTALKYGLDLSMQQCEELVYAWRRANGHIVRFWRTMGQACAAQVRRNEGRALTVTLPSEHKLYYWDPEVDPESNDTIIYTTSRGRTRAWGGKLVENYIQSMCRHIMARAMVLIAGLGYRVVGTVHDEGWFEVREEEAERAVEQITRVMRSPPKWAPDLPLNCEVKVMHRYSK